MKLPTFNKFIKVDSDHYSNETGESLKREYGETPNGNPLCGRWVLRNSEGLFIDFDQYLNDLISHYQLEVVYDHKI